MTTQPNEFSEALKTIPPYQTITVTVENAPKIGDPQVTWIEESKANIPAVTLIEWSKAPPIFVASLGHL